MITNGGYHMFTRFFVCALTAYFSFVLFSSNTFAQESVYELPWTLGAAEIDIPHIPATLQIDENQAVVTGISAIDFERVGTGNITFRAPAVVVNLNEQRQIIDNAYIQYAETGYIGLDNWQDATRPQVLARMFRDSLAKTNKSRPKATRLRFSKWVDTPVLDKENATIYYAIELEQGEGVYWVNSKALKLTRNGFIAFTWIGTRSQFLNSKENLEQLVSNTIPDKAEAYTDFVPKEDFRASFEAGELLEKTLSGEPIIERAAKGILIGAVVALSKKFWWLILIPVTVLWTWLKGRKAATPQNEKRLSKFRQRWLWIFLTGLVATAVILWVALEFRYSAPFPTEPDLNSYEGVVWQVQSSNGNVHLTLMGHEQPFTYHKLHGSRGTQISEAALQSYKTGSRVTVQYSRSDISDDPTNPITILAFKAGENSILTLDQSREGAHNNKMVFVILGSVVLAISLGLMITGLVLRAQIDTEHSAEWALIANTIVIAAIVLGRFAYGEWVNWSNQQVRLAQAAYENSKSEKALDVVAFALSWSKLSEIQRAELLMVKGNALQDLGNDGQDDELLLSSVYAWDQALQISPSNTDALKGIGNSFLYLGAYPEAAKAFQRMEDHGAYYWSFVRQAQIERTLSRYSRAEEFYQKAHEHFGKWYGMPLNYHRAKNQILQGKFSEAVTSIDQGLEYQGDYAWAHAYRGCAHVSLVDLSSAEKDYNRALEIVRTRRLEGDTPEDISEAEQTFLAILANLTSGSEATDNVFKNFCKQHFAPEEHKRKRSSKMPARFERSYLMSDLEKTADQGDTKAMFDLAIKYAEAGDPVLYPDTEIRYWFQRAADLGHAWSQNEVGNMYKEGTYGVEIDLKKSVGWFRKAAEGGDEIATHNLGLAYRDGLGVQQDDFEATKYFLQSAEKGYANAYYEASIRLKEGLGTEVDIEKSVEFEKKAKEGGFTNHRYLQEALGSVDFIKDSYVMGLFEKFSAQEIERNIGGRFPEWPSLVYRFANVLDDEQTLKALASEMASSSDGENSELMRVLHQIANLDFDQFDIERDKTKFTFTRIAAVHGHKKAQARLAEMYAAGIGTKKDPSMSDYWGTRSSQD